MVFTEALASATVVVEAALLAVLFVADLLHPVNRLAVETLLNGDVCHGGGGWRASPAFFPWGGTCCLPPAKCFRLGSPRRWLTTSRPPPSNLCPSGGRSCWANNLRV